MTPPAAHRDRTPTPDSGLGRHLATVFVLSVVFYVVWFSGVEGWRRRRGPWEVAFGADPQRNAVLEVSQPKLGIRRVQIVLVGALLPADFTPRTVVFRGPEAKDGLPFGEIKFLDTTFLPGTVTLSLYGHEIELLPRVLIVDKAEHSWQVGARIELTAQPHARRGSPGDEAEGEGWAASAAVAVGSAKKWGLVPRKSLN